MAEIIIKAQATDEQVAAVAKHLWYKEKLQEEKEVKATEKDEEGKDIETTRIDIVEVDNPQTDDEYVREKLTESVISLIWDAFIKEQLEEMEAQKAAMISSSKEELKKSITTEKKW